MRELEDRLRERAQILDEHFPPVALAEIERQLTERPAKASESVAWIPRTRRGGPLVAMAVAVAVLLVFGIPAFLNRLDDRSPAQATNPAVSHLDTADLFMDAWVNGDAITAATLFTPDGKYGAGITKPEGFADLHSWFEAVGWKYYDYDCQVEPVHTPGSEGVANCLYSFDTALSRALGWVTVRDSFLIVVNDLGVVFASERNGFDAHRDIWFVFKDWIKANYPEDLEKMFLFPVGGMNRARGSSEPPFDALNAFPLLDANSIRLWKRYVESFVADPEAITAAKVKLEVAEYVARLVEVCKLERDAFWAEASGLWETETSNFQQYYGHFGDLGASLKWHNAAVHHSQAALVSLLAEPRPPGAGADFDEFFSLIEAETQVLREVTAAAAAGNLRQYESLLGDRISATHAKGDVASGLGYWLWACPIELPS